MRRHLQWLEATGLVLAVGWLSNPAGLPARSEGYLPVAGPAPLRYRPPTVAAQPVALPPLVVPDNPDPNAGLSSPDSPPAVATLTGSTNPPVPPPFAGSSPEPGQAPNPAILELPQRLGEHNAAATAGINPQSVLGLLAPLSTNRMGNPVLVPVFVPPVPPSAPPSSQATYEVR